MEKAGEQSGGMVVRGKNLKMLSPIPPTIIPLTLDATK
jgi:hypothetical protein